MDGPPVSPGSAAPDSRHPAAPEPLRLLIVEDDPADVDLCVRTLRKAGFGAAADVVARAEDLRRRLRDGAYDVILSDFRLFGWTATEAFEIARLEAAETPFILVTGSMGDEGAVEWIKRGAADYVLKGRLERLPLAIRRALEERRLREEGEAAAAALRRSEAQYRELFENATEAVLVFEPTTGLIMEVNAQACETYGYSRGEMIGRSLSDLTRGGDLGSLVARVLAEGRRRNHEAVHYRKDGSPIDVLVNYAVTEYRGLEAILAAHRDVTERKRLESRLRELQKLEAIGRLAGGIAHDFNNLLTVIDGYFTLLLESLPPAERAQKSATEVKRAIERAVSLTSQLLTFNGRKGVQPRSLELNGVVGSMEMLLRRLLGEGIEIDLRLEPGQGLVRADPTGLEQVIMNLAVNGRDAMKGEGRLTISTRNAVVLGGDDLDHPAVPQGSYVVLSVSDTGSGMDAATQSRIFEPFFTTKQPGKGTGLGLSIVHGVVKQAGGHVRVHSDPGRGTTFDVYLPRSDAPLQADSPSGRMRALPRQH